MPSFPGLVLMTLAVCVAIPASAAPKHTKASRVEQCTGYLTARENGECVHTQWFNPDRVPPALNCGPAALCYRGRHKKIRS